MFSAIRNGGGDLVVSFSAFYFDDPSLILGVYVENNKESYIRSHFNTYLP